MLTGEAYEGIATGVMETLDGVTVTWLASINSDDNDIVDVQIGLGTDYLPTVTLCTGSFEVTAGDVNFGTGGSGTASVVFAVL